MLVDEMSFVGTIDDDDDDVLLLLLSWFLFVCVPRNGSTYSA